MAVTGLPGEIGKDPDELPSAEEQEALGFHTFSDFSEAQAAAYTAAYYICLAEVDAGNYLPDREGQREAAEAARPGTGDAAWEGCSDAVSGTPIAGSGITPPP